MENWSVNTDFRRSEGFQGETVIQMPQRLLSHPCLSGYVATFEQC